MKTKIKASFLSLEEIIESSIVDQWEPETNDDAFLLDDMDDLFNSFNTPSIKPVIPLENSVVQNGSKLISEQLPANPSFPTIVPGNNENSGVKISTVSELIDNNTEDIFGNMLDNNFFPDDMLTGINNAISEKANPGAVETNVSLPSADVSEESNNNTPYSEHENQTAFNAPPIVTSQNSSYNTREQPSSTVLSNYVNEILSNPTPAGLDNEKLVIMTTLQTNLELAKAMGTILKHSEVQEVGLSEDSLSEMRNGYQNCIKRISKAKHFLSSIDKKRRQKHIEQQLLGSHSVSPQDSISSINIDNSFFENFAENASSTSST